jgi:hypothetical protein
MRTAGKSEPRSAEVSWKLISHIETVHLSAYSDTTSSFSASHKPDTPFKTQTRISASDCHTAAKGALEWRSGSRSDK